MRMISLISTVILTAALPVWADGTQPAGPATQPAGAAATQPVALTASQLDNLTAPIALMPDTLITQILFASAHPADVAAAEQWLEQHPSPAQADIDAQNWHPSVKALATVPGVLKTMTDSLAWTRSLGAAFMAQKDAVMASIQRTRAEAQAVANANGAAPQQPQAAAGAQPQAAAQQPQVVYVQTPVYVPQYVPTFSYSSYSNGYPYCGYSTGPTIIITGGGGGGRSGIIQQNVVGGIVGKAPPLDTTVVSPFVSTGVGALRGDGTRVVLNSGSPFVVNTPRGTTASPQALRASAAPAPSRGPSMAPQASTAIIVPPVRVGH